MEETLGVTFLCYDVEAVSSVGVHGESRRPGAIWIDRLVSSAATPDRQGSRAVFAMPRWTSRSSASRVTLSLAPFFMVLLFVRNVCSKSDRGGPCRCNCQRELG